MKSPSHTEPEKKIEPLAFEHDDLLNKLVCFFKLKHNEPEAKKIANALEESEGECNGLVMTVATGIKLQLLKQKPIKPIDNWEKWQNVIDALSKWDGKDLKTLPDHDAVMRFYQSLHFIQNIKQFLPIPQGEMQNIYEDTRGRLLQKEYSIAAPFHAKDFLTLLSDNKQDIFDALVQPNKIVQISSHDHDTCVMLINNNYYYIGNSGVKIFSQQEKRELIVELLTEHQEEVNPDLPCQLGFRVFDFAGEPAGNYPKQSDILEQLVVNKKNQLTSAVTGSAQNYNQFHGAVGILCANSLKFFLEKLKNPEDINIKDPNGNTVLHLAAETGNVELVKLLKTNPKLDLNSKTDRNLTPLHFAAIHSNAAVVKFLLEDKQVEYDAISVDGNTPLHLAVMRGQTEIVKLLLDRGADMTIKNKGGFSPIDVITLTDDKSLPKMEILAVFHFKPIKPEDIQFIQKWIDIVTPAFKVNKGDQGALKELQEIMNYGKRKDAKDNSPLLYQENVDTTKYYRIMLVLQNIINKRDVVVQKAWDSKIFGNKSAKDYDPLYEAVKIALDEMQKHARMPLKQAPALHS